jgi:hypothetical protein
MRPFTVVIPAKAGTQVPAFAGMTEGVELSQFISGTGVIYLTYGDG